MRLICQTCAKAYELPHGRRRWSNCPECRRKAFSRAARRREARRRATDGPPAAALPIGPEGRVDLDALIRDLDAASKRALKAALAVAADKL
jgi:hypothetical protein